MVGMRILILATLVVLGPAARGQTLTAKDHYDRATAAFSLGSYAEAAEEYEKAFKLKPDKALLYNAAQAHRIAGNKQRALTLYQNYLRVFGDEIPNRAEVQRHVSSLKAAIAAEAETANAPPTKPAPAKIEPTPQPAPAPQPAPQPAPVAQPAPQPAPATAAVVATRPADKPLIKKPWFWATIGGAAAVLAIGIGVGVGVGAAPRDPSPTLGSFPGN